MATALEDLRILQMAEEIADNVWRLVSRWEPFAKDVVGKQLARAMDSVGANIAESYGRYHYGEKLRHLYFARGSLFEAKYWINRAKSRQLMPVELAEEYGMQLSKLAHSLNVFAASLKRQRSTAGKPAMEIREPTPRYMEREPTDLTAEPLFSESELHYLSQ